MDGIRFICMLILVLAVTGRASSQASSQASSPGNTGNYFNCKRTGQRDLCSVFSPGSSCSTVDPTVCVCAETTVEGIHCVPTVDATNSCPTKNCSGNGQCFVKSDTNEEICYCKQNYDGDDCELLRGEVECNRISMRVTVRPHGDFQGMIYAKSFPDNASCQLTEDTAGEYSASFDFNPAQCEIRRTTTDEAEIFEIKIRVVYNNNPLIFFEYDQVLTAICIFNREHNLTSSSLTVNGTDSLLEAATGQDLVVPARFDIEDGDGGVILTEDSDPVLLGADVSLAVSMDLNDAFRTFKVSRCFASNLPSSQSDDPSYEKLSLVDLNGCPEEHPAVRGDHVFEDEPSTDVAGKTLIPIRAFVFAASNVNGVNSVFFTCTVLFCPLGDDACDPEDCEDGVVGRGRRKREASEESVTMSQAIRVRVGDATVGDVLESDERENTKVSTEECLGDPKLQTIVYVMGVGLLALLLALIVLAVLLCRRRRSGGDNKKVMEDDHSMGSSTQTLHMHIPRPKV